LCADPKELKQPMEDPETAFELIWEKNHFDYVSASDCRSTMLSNRVHS
jgi:hypothetical protein